MLKQYAKIKADPIAYEKRLAYQRSRQERHQARRRFKLTGSEYKPDICEVCGFKDDYTHRNICLDHDHKTGKFRGWLCSRCNLAVGLARDDEEILLKLAMYLEKHKRAPDQERL
jgi:hypothetical protein